MSFNDLSFFNSKYEIKFLQLRKFERKHSDDGWVLSEDFGVFHSFLVVTSSTYSL
jgi:hypothetical protein